MLTVLELPSASASATPPRINGPRPSPATQPLWQGAREAEAPSAPGPGLRRQRWASQGAPPAPRPRRGGRASEIQLPGHRPHRRRRRGSGSRRPRQPRSGRAVRPDVRQRGGSPGFVAKNGEDERSRGQGMDLDKEFAKNGEDELSRGQGLDLDLNGEFAKNGKDELSRGQGLDLDLDLNGEFAKNGKDELSRGTGAGPGPGPERGVRQERQGAHPQRRQGGSGVTRPHRRFS
ncbi:translation initiation factor IF-2-like [Hordeum vulgare subsp. vulgare]|uniref:translation initiation factor IF-2-like n=1 Tax=Hordeum vulgare subsp. vulgare TaxID=112509 RepID=UPI001D1A541A|nr:translation initiation factor IF-2-like [Hordeum vulgare subsp. vulgare]